MKKTKGNETRLDNLQVGAKFEIVGCEHLYRNLVLAKYSDCATMIRGEKKDNDKWVLLQSHTISNGTPVRQLW